MTKYLAIGAVIAMAALAFQNLRCQSSLQAERASHQATVARVAEAAAQAVQAHQQEAQRQARAVAELDRQYTEALNNAQIEADSLRDSIRSGERRLYVTTTSSSCDPVPGTTTTPGVDHAAGRAELDPDHAARIIRITDRGDRAIRQLQACQAYVLEISPR